MNDKYIKLNEIGQRLINISFAFEHADMSEINDVYNELDAIKSDLNNIEV